MTPDPALRLWRRMKATGNPLIPPPEAELDELAIVSAALAYPEIFEYVRPALVPDDFADPTNRAIWAALVAGLDAWAIQQRLPHHAQRVAFLVASCPDTSCFEDGGLAKMALEICRAATKRREHRADRAAFARDR